MPPPKHAILSASSSHRWLNCTPSARLEQAFADRETEAAAEGSAAHALAVRAAPRQPEAQHGCPASSASRRTASTKTSAPATGWPK